MLKIGKAVQRVTLAGTVALFGVAFSGRAAATLSDGSVLPLSPPSESMAKSRLQDSTMKWAEAPQRLPKDAPNIIIVLIDDVGFGIADTFGGEVHTPTLTSLAEEGIR